MPATASNINVPVGLAADDTGNIYIADNSLGRVRKVNLAGIISTVAGNGTFLYSGDNIPASSAQIVPVKVTVNSSGNIFIADQYNFRVYKVDLAGIIHTVTGNGVENSSGNGGPATAASFCDPTGVATDACGNLYITDAGKVTVPICTGYDIRKITFDFTGTPSITISPSPNDTICAGTVVTYSATVSGSSTFAYQWLVNGAVISAATNSTYSYTPANGDSVGCVFMGTGQCSGNPDTVSSNAIHMVVMAYTEPSVTLSGITTAPIGTMITLTATVTNAGSSYNIKWFNNSVLFNTTTLPTVAYTKAAGTDNITATVISTSAGCYDSTTSAVHMVTVTPAGVNTVIPEQLSIYPNPSQGVLHIDGVTTQTHYQLLNIVGSSLLQNTLTPGSNTIPIQSLPPAIYLLQLTNTDAPKTIKKIIKQ